MIRHSIMGSVVIIGVGGWGSGGGGEWIWSPKCRMVHLLGMVCGGIVLFDSGGRSTGIDVVDVV